MRWHQDVAKTQTWLKYEYRGDARYIESYVDTDIQLASDLGDGLAHREILN